VCKDLGFDPQHHTHTHSYTHTKPKLLEEYYNNINILLLYNTGQEGPTVTLRKEKKNLNLKTNKNAELEVRRSEFSF
jgi:hypothetical protein